MESVLVIHTGTNNLTDGVYTMEKVRKLVKVLREIDESEVYIRFSSVIYYEYKDLEDERNEVNMKFKKYCEGKGLAFIENVSINELGLNNSKLHLNKKGINTVFNQASARGAHLLLGCQRREAYSREALFRGRHSLNMKYVKKASKYFQLVSLIKQ